MNDRVTLSEAIEILAGYGPAVWLGVLAAAVTFIVEIILCAKGVLEEGGKQKEKREKKKGNDTGGTQKDFHNKDGERGGKATNRLYTGIYEYTVEGVTRTKRITLSGTKPPYTLYFYYTSTPEHVFSQYDTGKNPLKILLYIIPVLAAYIVMTALGFRP